LGSLAAILAAPYPDAVAVDFRDGSMVIKDTATPANNFSGPWASKISLTRATAAYYLDDSNVWQTAASGVLRTTPQKGALIEQQSTNLLLNSLIDGTNLSTQSVAVSAQPYTLSFYGTGTVTLSGAFVGSLVGSGAFPTRSRLTFTPSAGTLTLTVTGTVQYAQLEPITTATSFIPTAGTSVTRNADQLSVLSTSSFNRSTTVGTLYASGITGFVDTTNFGYFSTLGDGTSANRFYIRRNASPGAATAAVVIASVADGAPATATLSDNTDFKYAAAFAVNDMAAVLNGGSPTTDATLTTPITANRLEFGVGVGGSHINSYLKQVLYVPQRLSNAAMQALTT